MRRLLLSNNSCLFLEALAALYLNVMPSVSCWVTLEKTSNLSSDWLNVLFRSRLRLQCRITSTVLTWHEWTFLGKMSFLLAMEPQWIYFVAEGVLFKCGYCTGLPFNPGYKNSTQLDSVSSFQTKRKWVYLTLDCVGWYIVCNRNSEK